MASSRSGLRLISSNVSSLRGCGTSRCFSASSIRPAKGPWSDPITRPTNRYLIIAEDYAEPSALARRLEVRDLHLEQAARGKEVGRIELGGGLLKRDFKDVDPELGPVTSLAGSVFVVHGESIEEVRARLNRDEYMQASVFDPSKIRIFPFLRSFNEQSVQIGNVAIGDTQPVSIRKPRGESTVKTSLNSRGEVYVKDPRASGKTINTSDRKSAENTLGHLRNNQSSQQRMQQQPHTLNNLRKQPALTIEQGEV